MCSSRIHGETKWKFARSKCTSGTESVHLALVRRHLEAPARRQTEQNSARQEEFNKSIAQMQKKIGWHASLLYSEVKCIPTGNFIIYNTTGQFDRNPKEFDEKPPFIHSSQRLQCMHVEIAQRPIWLCHKPFQISIKLHHKSTKIEKQQECNLPTILPPEKLGEAPISCERPSEGAKWWWWWWFVHDKLTGCYYIHLHVCRHVAK